MTPKPPREPLYFSSVIEVSGTRPLTGNYCETLQLPVDLIEHSAYAAALDEVIKLRAQLAHDRVEIERLEELYLQCRDGHEYKKQSAIISVLAEALKLYAADEWPDVTSKEAKEALEKLKQWRGEK